jgi:hypothetical protein
MGVMALRADVQGRTPFRRVRTIGKSDLGEHRSPVGELLLFQCARVDPNVHRGPPITSIADPPPIWPVTAEDEDLVSMDPIAGGLRHRFYRAT